ncbi:cupin domain-containing protein [Granulicella arctica]|uniref:hypothetical protein n=1 Tax=Granulicella arctica TaxID=940613 RepID=UPI0021E02EA4|nr:hypothetical protein [Granulicella arctica]
MRTMLLCVALTTISTSLVGQVAQAPAANLVDVRTAAAIDAEAKILMNQAKNSPSGTAGVALETYPGHLTMLTVRVKSGGAEIHAGFNDIFIVEDGQADVLTGGTVVDPKQVSLGETRGSRVEGGTSHVIRKGDVIHISANVPHQTTVAPGETFTYYVIKVAVPQQ